MTKILHIPTGEFVTFLSSIRYDNTVSINNSQGRVIIFEDSFAYDDKKREIEQHLEYLLQSEERVVPGLFFKNCSINEFEILYD